MKYKILSHPAELRLRIYGGTLEELFINSAETMARILSQTAVKSELRIKKSKSRINIKSPDINSLLVDFLSEILAKSQINKKIYKIKKLKVYKEESRLEGEIEGTPVEKLDEDIKAVTYEDLDIKKIRGRWQTKLVFDI